jgi:hypothetical protein
MNKLDIIKALRQLDRDIRELGQSPITKRSAKALLSSDRDGKGGPLVQWFNSESDDRMKAMIHEVIGLVTQAGFVGREDKIPQAAKQLGPLADRLAEGVEGAVVDANDDPWVTVRAGDCSMDRSTLLRHAKDADRPWIELEGRRGWYRIRQSRLTEYE